MVTHAETSAVRTPPPPRPYSPPRPSPPPPCTSSAVPAYGTASNAARDPRYSPDPPPRTPPPKERRPPPPPPLRYRYRRPRWTTRGAPPPAPPHRQPQPHPPSSPHRAARHLVSTSKSSLAVVASVEVSANAAASTTAPNAFLSFDAPMDMPLAAASLVRLSHRTYPPRPTDGAHARRPTPTTRPPRTPARSSARHRERYYRVDVERERNL